MILLLILLFYIKHFRFPARIARQKRRNSSINITALPLQAKSPDTLPCASTNSEGFKPFFLTVNSEMPVPPVIWSKSFAAAHKQNSPISRTVFPSAPEKLCRAFQACQFSTHASSFTVGIGGQSHAWRRLRYFKQKYAAFPAQRCCSFWRSLHKAALKMR